MCQYRFLDLSKTKHQTKYIFFNAFIWLNKKKYDRKNYNNISGIIGSKEVVGNMETRSNGSPAISKKCCSLRRPLHFLKTCF